MAFEGFPGRSVGHLYKSCCQYVQRQLSNIKNKLVGGRRPNVIETFSVQQKVYAAKWRRSEKKDPSDEECAEDPLKSHRRQVSLPDPPRYREFGVG